MGAFISGMFGFPSPTGVNNYESVLKVVLKALLKFPSPTEVNYYELKNIVFKDSLPETSFRPQQGLTIMN